MSDPVFEPFTPICEKARSDGTIGVKIIGPGWGSSGYYSRQVLERDIPRIFPAGTQMFWNHATATEEMERPEGDLNALAGVTVSNPIWMDNGPKGPGMYADARPFTGYAETIDEIGEHIGVSIRALGRHSMGEADGRQGRIIDELVAGKSIDYVTVPGAGGAIISVFESAGNGRLPDPVNEARNIGEWLESRLHLALTTIADDMYGDGRISREERMAMSGAIGSALDAYRTDLMGAAPQLFQRDTWASAPDSADIAIMNGNMESARPDAANPTEDHMSEQELKEAQDALALANAELAKRDAALAKMREQLILREAQEFVSGVLAKADLPDMTKQRLQRELTANPLVVDGKLDEAAYQKCAEAAITEARAEIAAITGGNGRITGMGGGSNSATPNLKESIGRLDAALNGMGYGGKTDGN